MPALFQPVIYLATLFLGASFAAEDLGENSGILPQMAGGMAAPRTRLLEDANLQGLSNIAVLTGREASQAANYFYSYVDGILEGTGGRDGVPRSPCFIRERYGDNSQESINFLERLAEDYQGALGYSSYLLLLTQHFCQDPSRSISYCTYLGETRRTVSTMTQSLANLVRFVNESTYQSSVATAKSIQLSDHKAGKTTSDQTDTPLPDHCSDPCYQQQASLLVRLGTLAAKYIPTDVNGYLDAS